MPKIFALRHQLLEQQAKLKQQAKAGSPDGTASSSRYAYHQLRFSLSYFDVTLTQPAFSNEKAVLYLVF